MSSKNKQADRNAQKRAAKKDTAGDEPAPAGPTGGPAMLVALSKSLITESCLLRYAPKLLRLLQAEGGPVSGATKPAPLAEDNDGETKDDANADDAGDVAGTVGDAPPAEETAEIYCALTSRLAWHNPLGLGKPESGADSMTMWLNFKGLAFDWGPRPSKRGTPKLDRIMTNLCNNLPQYLHIMLFGFMLNCIFFRSFFACLPWLIAYQLMSLKLPLDTLEKVPQVPLSKVPLKFRAAGTLAINALLWMFFLYEAVWKCNLFIELILVGFVVFHAYSVTPGSMPN